MFLTKFNHSNEDPSIENTAEIEIPEDTTIDLVEFKEKKMYKIPFLSNEPNSVRSIILKKGSRYLVIAYSHYDFLTNDEIDQLNAAKTIQELISNTYGVSGFFYLSPI